jgi:hypothetical protein
MTNNVIGAFGIVDLSPIQVSNMLRALNVSHTYIGVHAKSKRASIVDVCGTAKEQPAWPVVVDRLSSIKRLRTNRQRLIYLIIDSRAALSISNANQALWPENRGSLRFDQSLRLALMSASKRGEPFALIQTEPSISDYVNAATKPVFLNHVQTAIYKIAPYTLQKEVRSLSVAYLAGAASLTVLKRKLKTSFKLEELSALMLSDRARALRDAVAQSRNTPVEQVAKTGGFEPFEINYVINSYARNQK